MTDTNPLISVCLACYNVEPYIADTLECVVSQTYKNLEIICIDDASTDDTARIIASFAERDPRVVLVKNSLNSGQSVSRNQSIDLARGSFVLFLDGDDLYDPEMIEKAVRSAVENQSDMVIWDYLDFTNESEIDTKRQTPSKLSGLSPKDRVALLQRPAFIWVRLIKLQIIKDLGLKFPVGLTRQDVPVHWELILKIENISLVPEKLSYYRQRSTATTYLKNERMFDHATVMQLTADFLESAKLYDQYKEEFLRQKLDFLYKMQDSIRPDLKPRALLIIRQMMGFDEWEYVKSNKPLLKQVRIYFLSLDGSVLHKAMHVARNLMRSAYRVIKK